MSVDTSTNFKITLDIDPVKLKIAEDNIPVHWNVGDDILGLYQVTELLGKGGMGQVHKLRHKIWDMDIAVKSPLRKIIQAESGLSNVIKESNTWIELGMHPNIVSCYYVRVLGKIPRLFIEFIDGGSLKDRISDGRLYEGTKEEILKRILDIAIQSARGLEFAHSHSLVHKDIKPANIMISENGLVKITDFGMAGIKKILDSNDTETIDGDSLYSGNHGFTPEYCSPEQKNNKSVTRMTDVWSWGLTVLEMFSGERTWSSGIAAGMALDDYLIHNKILKSNVLIPGIPGKLVRLLKKCFIQEPSERPENMSVVEEELFDIYYETIGGTYKLRKIKEIALRSDELNNRAISYLDLGREEKAIECWQKALIIDPEHFESTYNYGYYRWQKAIITDDNLLDSMNNIKHFHKSNPEYWLSLGWIHYERGDGISIDEIQDSVNRICDDKFLSALSNTPGLFKSYSKQFSGNNPLITSICPANNEYLIFIGGWDNSLMLMDFYSGDLISVFSGHTHKISSINMLKHNKLVLTGSWDNTMKLWDVETGNEIRSFTGHQHFIKSVDVSVDNKLAVSGSLDKTIKLWDVESGLLLRSFTCTSKILSVCLSPEGKYILSGGDDNEIRLWDVETGEIIRVFSGHTGNVNSVLFYKNGKYIVSGSSDKTIKIWDAETGTETCNYTGSTNSIIFLFVTPDEKHVVSANKDKYIQYWDIDSEKCIRTMRTDMNLHISPCISVYLSLLVIGGYNNIQLIGLKYDALLSGTNFPVISKINLLPDIIETVKDIDEKIKSVYIHLKFNDHKKAYDIISSLQKDNVQIRSQELLELKTLCLQRLNAGRKIFRDLLCVNTFSGFSGTVNNISFLNDDNSVLTIKSNNTLSVININTNRVSHKILHERSALTNISSLCLSVNGRRALVGINNYETDINDFRGLLLVADLDFDKPLKKYEAESEISTITTSPDGKFILIGSGGLSFSDKTYNSIVILEERSLDELKKLEGHTGKVNSLCCSPDGKFLLSGSDDKTVRIWIINNGKELMVLSGHKDSVNSVCYSPDGRYALSCSSDRTVRKWDVFNGNEILRLKGHTDKINAVCFSPDGKYILSGSDDRSVRIWDALTGDEIRSVYKHDAEVVSVSFSSNSKYAVSGSKDGTISLWKFDWDWDYVEVTDFDEECRPFLEIFLELHRPYDENNYLVRGLPVWDEDDFNKLYDDLSKNRGFGYVKKEGISADLTKMMQIYINN